VTRRVSWTSEQPPGGGPVAALRAGLTEVRNDVVLLLAADLPLLDAAAVDVLVAAAADGGDGAVYVDDRGREQWLCSAWHSAALRRRLGDGVADSMHRLLAPLQFARLPAPASIADCDTPDDVRRTEEMLT
jgi:molybdopterin-guanine dinucleotide biosynthesis protein A